VPAEAFTLSSLFLIAAAGCCATAACFSEDMDSLYALELAGDRVTGSYTGTLSEQDIGTSASGTSLLTFEIPAEPAA
jgi:hypothetical protein